MHNGKELWGERRLKSGPRKTWWPVRSIKNVEEVKRKKNPSSMTGCALKKMATTHKERKKESAPLVSKSLISIT